MLAVVDKVLGIAALTVPVLYLIYTLLTQKRRREKFNEQFVVPRADAGASGIAFGGTLKASRMPESPFGVK